jgi:hypothetical protein
MSPARRIQLLVLAIALLVAAATVGITLLQTRGETRAAPTGERLRGRPPLEFNFGVRTDAESRALSQAAALYNKGKVAPAESVFRHYNSIAAEIGRAYARWPDLASVERIAAAHPASALALLHLGLAYDWSGQTANARWALRRAEAAEPNSPFALAAASLLHPEMPGLPLPQFVPESRLPQGATGRTFAAQLSALARLAASGNLSALLYHGVAEQELGHRLSAEHDFAGAARLAPTDPEALTAAAFGRFTKDKPSAAFRRLGPLAKRFPHAAVVRFHLGYLLIWLRQTKLAKNQLKLVLRYGPSSPYAAPARTLLKSLSVAPGGQ